MTIRCNFRALRREIPRRAEWWLAAALGLALTAGLAAEEPEPAAEGQAEPTAFEDAITVTAPPIVEGNAVDRYGRLVAAVSERQIDDLNAQDPSSALRRVPGVVISRYNPIGAFGGGDGGAIFIRGHGSGRPGAEIATLVDGIPRFVGIWTHPLLDTLSLDPVERLDVYRSAQPVLVGNMAFGAVDAVSKRRLKTGSGGRLVGSYGAHDTVVGRVEYGHRSGSADYYFTASHRRSDGHRAHADGEVEALSGRLGFRLGAAWDLSLQVHHSSGAVNDPGAEGSSPPPVVGRYATDGEFYLATLSHVHGARHGHLKLYLEDGFADWRQWDDGSGEPFHSITRTKNYGLRLRETLTPWPRGELVLGVDHDLYGGRFVERWAAGDRLPTDLHFRTTAPYLMVSHEFGERVTVTPSLGVRYADSRYFGDAWGVQAGVRVGLGRQVLYANYAHGFNLPGVYAAVTYGGWGRGDQWQELGVETIDHVEIGWTTGVGKRLRFDVALFRDQVADALRFVPPPPPPPLYANVGDYEVRGAELSLRADATEHLSFFVAATVNRSDPDEVPNLPRTTAVGGISYAGGGGWRLNLDLEWVDERFVLNPRFASQQAAVDGYFLLNGRAALPLRWLVRGLRGELFAAGENLGDEEYQHRLGYPMPGRSWTLGLDLKF